MHKSPTATPCAPDSPDTRTGLTKVFIGRSPRLPPGKMCTTLGHACIPSPTANWQMEWCKDWAVVLVPPLRRSKERYRLLQHWVGVIQELTNDGLVVTLLDQMNPQNPDEEVRISLAEIPEQDHLLLKPGSVLYWSIGYREDQGRPRERYSRIRARRLPVWSEDDLERGRACAQQVIADMK